MAKRSATFKQFLLRVHPDHFRRLPQVHDENLQSIQLLNQFMDERSATSWSLARSSSAKKVHFSAYLAPHAPLASDSDNGDTRTVKRFALALSPSIETAMQAILRECGVVIRDAAPLQQQQQQQQRSTTSTNTDARRPRDRTRRRKQQTGPQTREASDMDFEFSMHDMYASLRAQSESASRRNRPILSMKDWLAFIAAEQTRAIEQQRYSAWLSIQSVRSTLQREFGIAEVATSCGWATLHLNATLMVLLKTLRKYTRAQSSSRSSSSSSMFTPSAFLRGACVDVSSKPSGIDVLNEYRVHLNPTDVPLQWIQVLEQVDDAMLQYMHSARVTLAALQAAATAALSGASIARGHTCAALPYRGFLQSMGTSNLRSRRDADTASSSVLKQLAVVVEDRHYAWRVLHDGRVQVPCDASFEDVSEFIDTNRSRIHEQRDAYATQERELAQVVAMCSHVLGVKTVTHIDSIPVERVIATCKELLKLAAQVHMGTVAPSSVPNELYGGANRDLATFLRGRRLRIARSFGLDQDGSFTLPFDWRA